MGLILPNTAAASGTAGILHPRTGSDARNADPYFAGLNQELADKGFLVSGRKSGLAPRMIIIANISGTISGRSRRPRGGLPRARRMRRS